MLMFIVQTLWYDVVNTIDIFFLLTLFLTLRCLQDKSDSKDLPTPSSTPTQSRKNRRRSNLFNNVS